MSQCTSHHSVPPAFSLENYFPISRCFSPRILGLSLSQYLFNLLPYLPHSPSFCREGCIKRERGLIPPRSTEQTTYLEGPEQPRRAIKHHGVSDNTKEASLLMLLHTMFTHFSPLCQLSVTIPCKISYVKPNHGKFTESNLFIVRPLVKIYN